MENLAPLLMLLFSVFLIVVVLRSLSSRQSNTASEKRPSEKKATTKEHNTCPFYEEEIKYNAVKCKHCNSFLKTKNSNTMVSMIGKTCPYCQFPIKQDSEAVQCQGCEVPHHRECWEENGGCTTLGCNSSSFKHYSNSSSVLTGQDRIEIDFFNSSDENAAVNISKNTKETHFSYPMANIGNRILAFIFDLLVAFVPVLIIVLFEGVLFILIWPIVYILLKDGFFDGQSWGKKIFGLMVVRLKDNNYCNLGNSVIRNFMIIVIMIISFLVTLVVGIIYLFYVFVFMVIVELIIIPASFKGRRLGDILAKTQVIDTNHYRAP